ncbi:MAG: hypothetical protein QM784_22695 [Polyangiaceae bacterium]
MNRDATLELPKGSAVPSHDQALAWFQETELDRVGIDPLVLKDINGVAWDPNLCRRLSELSGGFCIAWYSERRLSRLALFAFFAGRTIEARIESLMEQPSWVHACPKNSLQIDDGVLFGRFCEALTHRTSADVVRPIRAMPESWYLPTAPSPDLVGFDWSREHPMSRIVLGNVTQPQLEDGLSKLRARYSREGWRVRHVTPTLKWDCIGTEIPYAFLQREGTTDDFLARDLAQVLERDVLHLVVPGRGQPFTWSLTTATGTTPQQKDHGVLALSSVCERILLPLSLPPIAIYWPHDEPGGFL